MKHTNETDNEQVAQRRAKLNILRESGNPFPNDFRRDSEAAVLLESLETKKTKHSKQIRYRFVLRDD